MGGRGRDKKGKGKGKMKAVGEGSRNKTVTMMKEQTARKETVAVTAATEKKEADSCVFLVRTRTLPPRTTEEKSVSVMRGPVCYKEDFHLIDLRSKSVIPNYLPTMLNCVGLGTMFMFNHQVYIFGDIKHYHELVQHNHNHNVEDNHIHKHTGSSHFSIFKRWEPFEMPDSNPNMVNPVALCDKMYCFGYPFLRPFVHDPWIRANFPRGSGSKVWNPLLLPDHLVEKRISFPVLPDPLNNRVIVHFPEMSMLYAFYPAPRTNECEVDNVEEVEDGCGGDWKRLASHFDTWCCSLAIVDNIIVFHSCVSFLDFAAYDLNTSTSMYIVWDFSRIGGFNMDFDAIFTLSNKEGLMCLAGEFDNIVHLLSFQVKLTSDKDLKFIAIDYQMHNIPPATGINDFILFSGSEL